MATRTATSLDWQRAADLVADAAAAESTHSLVDILIRGAHVLFEADIVICDRFDQHARQIAFQMYPAPTPQFIELTLAPFLAFWHQHPFQPDWVNEIASGRVAFLSDRISNRDFRRTDLWNTAYVHLRAKNQLMFGGHIEQNRYFCVTCNRLGRDYDARDRDLGRFLQARLTKLFQQHARRDRAQHAIALLSHPNAAFAIVDPRGQVIEFSERAREVLGFAGSAAPLHPLIAALAAPNSPSGERPTLTRHSIGKLDAFALRPTDASPSLVLFERSRQPDPAARAKLTLRETEILHWFGEGKNNPDIGLLLGISPRTVEKHCETLFAKLGVENRLAAALLARSTPA